jgi:hypothetical protein
MEKPRPKPRSTAARSDYGKPRSTARGEFSKPRSAPRGDFGKPRDAASGRFSKPRTSPAGEYGAPRSPRPPSRFRSEERTTFGDPYKPARRPPQDREEGGGRSFTVNLDPDVARVFRGDASVNKALRLVMQLMQVVQGPPRASYGDREGGRPPRSTYQGNPEARGFERKPRFDPDEVSDEVPDDAV